MDHLPAFGLAGALGRLGAMGPNDRPYPQQASSALDCNMGKEWMSNFVTSLFLGLPIAYFIYSTVLTHL